MGASGPPAGSTTWARVARADELPARGDQRAVRTGVEGVLLVRDRDGELRAFFNVCRHRGHELLEPGSAHNRNAIRCPYHAWVYGLDGHLAGTPRFGEGPSLRRDELPLIPVPVREWDGWIFVDAAGEEPDTHHRHPDQGSG